MVKANELRIGNFIRRGKGSSEDIVKVVSVCEWRITTSITDSGMPPSEFEPISLTPEILEKCGARDPYNFYKIGGNEQVRCYEYDIRGVLLRTAIRPEHLHQLQNLFFALTGEELEINIVTHKK